MAEREAYKIMIKLFENDDISFWKVKHIANALKKEGFPATAKFISEVATLMEDKYV